MTSPAPKWRIEAPAKINLGLEILERRTDGYHEIRSILAMVDLADTLTISRSDRTGDPAVRIAGMQNDGEDNLIAKAANQLAQALDVQIVKRIPVAAGLGGASSDAAATLLAANEMRDDPLTPDKLRGLAATLGSDISFFLGAPCAIVSGRGTKLDPLAPPEGWIVLATPSVEIPAKTRTLYGSLVPSDFSDGSRILSQATAIRSGDPLDSSLLGNAFSRGLKALLPSVDDLERDMSLAGAPFVALSGAGPTHYTVVSTRQQACDIAGALIAIGTIDVHIHVTKFRSLRLGLESLNITRQ